MKSTVMVGPSPDARGGMASVAAIYRSNGLFSDGSCRYLVTAIDGAGYKKAWVAFAALARFGALLVGGNVGLLHVHGASRGSFRRKRLFMVLARLFSVPVIFHLHGGEFRQFLEKELDANGRDGVLSTLRGCRLVYCLNREVGNWLQMLLPGIPVEVMPNPVSSNHLAPLNDRVGRNIIFMGRLEREKGVFDLLSAYARVAGRMPGARLVLCGAGSQRDALAHQANELGIAESTVFPGWLEGKEKSDLLATAQVFVLPSYAEGMPMSVLEAMSAGIPVVATRVGACAEMLDDGRCGFLVAPGKVEDLAGALIAAFSSGPEIFEMKRLARERVEACYSANVVIERLRATYAAIAA